MAKRKRASSVYQLERRRYWQRIISQWQQSGLSQAAFCRRHTLQPQQFSKWKMELATASPAAPKPSVQPDFIEVRSSASCGTCEIITPDDYRIRIEGECRPDVLSAILSAVRPPC